MKYLQEMLKLISKKGNVITQSHSSLYLPLENLEELKKWGKGRQGHRQN